MTTTALQITEPVLPGLPEGFRWRIKLNYSTKYDFRIEKLKVSYNWFGKAKQLWILDFQESDWFFGQADDLTQWIQDTSTTVFKNYIERQKMDLASKNVVGIYESRKI